MSLGSKILIFDAATPHSLRRLSYKRHISTRLLCRQICNLPELNIRIFQSAYFLFFY